MFFLTVEGNFRYIDVELSKVASGCWIKPFKAHLKCRHVFSRFKSVFGVPTQGSFCLTNAAETPTPHIHESLSGPIWCPGSKHKWQTCPKLCHPKKGMTIEIPCVVFLCVALLSPASRMRLTKPSFTNWVRDLAHCRCAKLSPQFFRHD